MRHSRILFNIYKQNPSSFLFSSEHRLPTLSQHRSIFTSSPTHASWMDTIRRVFTGKKGSTEDPKDAAQSFTLLHFADVLKNARRLGTFKQCMVGQSSEATFVDAFEKQEAINL
ncbi:hypothetical protein SLEP1_g48060 [Rubroshorea leprosula]|uniref:Uncharacterized protein n=1 Tax=Rubroshorea leprosula TaxID=152421 RepID=A0AAV5LTH4_9ROSI|nr:hypothetical protein SLEP1_g48060 [Rubroshorea leprosula]